MGRGGRGAGGQERAPGASDPWQGELLRLCAEARGYAKKLTRLCVTEGCVRDLPQIPGNTTLVVVVYRGKSHHVCPVITVYGVTTLACTARIINRIKKKKKKSPIFPAGQSQ